jgi:predicted nuclease of restriction endonuclease-like RecB superfamily
LERSDMALALSDFKKTSRTTELGRQLYPYQIRDDRYLASISYAINYYEQMLGRRRRELEAATLIEFFGDPKLARGLVACLGRTYRWHQQQFSEVLPEAAWRALRRLNLTAPADLRALLYRHVNDHCDGFLLPAERRPVIEAICAELGLTPPQFEFLLHLDDEGEAVLVRGGATPEAADVVALYNFHSLETALRNARSITLRLGGDVWPLLLSVRNLARRYNLRYDITEGPRDLFGQHMVVTWHGAKDALGNWSRTGRRIVRGLLRLLGAHPDCAIEGTALVTLSGKASVIKLSRRELTALSVSLRGAETAPDEVWETTLDTQLAAAWSRALAKGETAGWRLRRDPEPLVLEKGVLIADFVAMRGPQRVPIFLPATSAGAEALATPLDGTNAAIVVTHSEAAAAFRGRKVPLVRYDSTPSVKTIVVQLESCFPAAAHRQPLDRWAELAALLDEAGFVAEADLPALLGCKSVAEAAATLRGWREGTAQYIPGLGLCTPQKLAEIGSMMSRAA